MKLVPEQYLRLQAFSFTFLLLAGCASVQQPQTTLGLSSMNLDAAARIANATPGSVLSVPVTKGGAPIEGTVGETYYAASNRECKRFVPLDMRGQSERVVCLHSSGIWYMQRALPVRSTHVQTQPVSSLVDVPAGASIVRVPAADVTIGETIYLTETSETTGNLSSSVPLEADATSPVFNVENGETLLKFSKRVTGKYANWLKIARHNKLEDPYTLSVGMPLQVPAELVKIN